MTTIDDLERQILSAKRSVGFNVLLVISCLGLGIFFALKDVWLLSIIFAPLICVLAWVARKEWRTIQRKGNELHGLKVQAERKRAKERLAESMGSSDRD